MLVTETIKIIEIGEELTIEEDHTIISIDRLKKVIDADADVLKTNCFKWKGIVKDEYS